MKARFVTLMILGLLALPSIGCAQESVASEVTLETEEQKQLYALGIVVSQRLPRLQLTEAEIAVLQAGFADGLNGREPRVEIPDIAQSLDEFVGKRRESFLTAEKAAGDAFREKLAAESGAEKLESGMIFIGLEPGSGPNPTVADRVTIQYRGTRRDGSEFDSSYENGEPATFPIQGVVPCFSEGLRKMKVGGKAKFVCPPELAYGDAGAPGRIDPGATLVFDVELLEVLATSAAPTETAPPAQ